MKKATFFLTLLLFISEVSSQTLNQAAVWPNANWTLGGTYTGVGLLLNPTTTDSQFKFDDNAVNSGNDDNDITATSPVINLKPAFDAGETGVKIEFQLSYRTVGSQVLKVEYFDADANGGTGAWVEFASGSSAPENDDTNNDYKTCTLGSDPDADIIFSIGAFTTNQLQNFQYRFMYDDNNEAAWGFCLNSPTISSFQCTTSTNLGANNINENSAQLTWTSSNSSNVEWSVEWGTQGFTLGTGSTVANINTNSYTLNGLQAGTSYDFYVQDDCNNGNGQVTSSWAGPFNFSTATLSLKDNKIEGFSYTMENNTLKLNAQNQIKRVTIYNLLSQKILEVSSTSLSLPIKTNHLKKGIYILRVQVGEEEGSYKILKE